MSNGLICDNCSTSLALKPNGEAENGEEVSWLHIAVGEIRLDACTRSCAHALLDDEAVVEAIEAWQEVIASIARDIREERAS